MNYQDQSFQDQPAGELRMHESERHGSCAGKASLSLLKSFMVTNRTPHESFSGCRVSGTFVQNNCKFQQVGVFEFHHGVEVLVAMLTSPNHS